jgi:hypothetical protein
MNIALANIKGRMNMSASTEFIGAQVFWSISEAGTVSRAQLEQIVKNAGIDEKNLPSEVTPCSAWTRAIAEFKKSDYVKHNNLLIDHEHVGKAGDKTNPPKGLLTVHTKNVDGNASTVAFKQQWALEFVKDAKKEQSGSAVISRCYNANPSAQDGLYSEVCRLYDAALSQISANDFREFIKRVLFAHHSVSMRPSGGIYFVPAEHMSIIPALKRVVESVGGSLFYTLELPKASVQTVETVKRTVAEELENELSQIEKKITTGLESIRALKSGQTSNTYNVLLTEINEYRARSEFYAELLSVKHGEITGKLDGLQKAVVDRVSSL